MSFSTPILFLIFNRPEITQSVFEEIKKQKPKYLYVAADGARPHVAEDIEKCKATRALVIDGIDWDCEVKTLFRDENLGCGIAVSEAITWFFENVEQGIILEDDCLPNSSFFSFCEGMLEYYKYDFRIMHVSGNSYAKNTKCENYYFTQLPFIWGWATWRRAWKLYDFNIKYISSQERTKILQKSFSNYEIIEYWDTVLKNFHLTPKTYTWDYQWFLSIWQNEGLVIQPCVNLCQNIGFGKDATHTTFSEHYLGSIKAQSYELKSYNLETEINSKLQTLNFYFYFKNKKNKSILNIFTMLPHNLLNKIKLKIGKIIYQLLYAYSQNENLPYQFGFLKNNVHNSIVSKTARLYPVYKISNSKIGDFSYLAQNATINNTSIGKFCSIGPNLISGWGVHPTNGISTHPMFYSTLKQNGFTLSNEDKIEEIKPIFIGNDVFIGMNVTILDGVTIGDGAVIGAGAVVSKDIPPYAIAVGNPIKVINYRFNEKIIDSLLTVKWWEFNENELVLIEKYFFDIEKFIKIIEKNN